MSIRPITISLVCYCFVLCVTAQWPMYEPGAPIDRSVIPLKGSIFGFGYGAALYSCREQLYSYPCDGARIPDSSICKNFPVTVSKTPYIKGPTFLSLGLADTLEIHCGMELTDDETQKSPEGTMLVYTTNGTYPDIYGPKHTPPVTIRYEAGEYMFLMARCIEPKLTASRIAYAERFGDETYMCYMAGGTWKYETYYKPLNLPQCQPWEYGLEHCDGQTIYRPGQPHLEPSPSVPLPTLPSPTVPGSSPTETRQQNSEATKTRLSFPSYLVLAVVSTALLCL